jgi:hypothetical protein
MKKEIGFSQNNFGEATVLSLYDTVTQLLLNVLYMRPGQLINCPHVGIDIRKYFLTSSIDDIDINEIKIKLQSQCSSLAMFIDVDSMKMTVVNGTLVIVVPLVISKEDETLLIGIKKKEVTGEVVYNTEIYKNLFKID